MEPPAVSNDTVNVFGATAVQCAYRFRSAVTGVEKSYLEPPDLVVYQPSNT